ncbi:glgB [Symbiodinium natans]|uniref:GlgB protein n=1 Tax=Symbiodinium natans TaxID=878477 RepID=A0A812PBU2_9DINO|nr:glgB [Symbiodinium natans]
MSFAEQQVTRKPGPLRNAEPRGLPASTGLACSISPLTTPASCGSVSTTTGSSEGTPELQETPETRELERLPSTRSKPRKATKSTALAASFLQQHDYLHVNDVKSSWGRKSYPLHTAVRQNQPATVRALLELGASRKALSRGLTAEESARRYERRWGGYSEVLSVFDDFNVTFVTAQECSVSTTTDSTSESEKQSEGSTRCRRMVL